MPFRASLLALVVLAASACFSPSPPEGKSCGPGDACPPGQSCQSGVCLGTGATGDAGPDPSDLGPFDCDPDTLALFQFDSPGELGSESCGSTQVAMVVNKAEPSPESPAPEFELAALLPDNGANLTVVGVPIEMLTLTVEMWLAISGDTPPGGGRVLTLADGDGAPVLTADLSLDGLAVALADCGGQTTVPLPRGPFVHLRLILGLSDVSIVLNGNLFEQLDANLACAAGVETVAIGAPDASSSGFIGRIDELRLSDISR